MQPITCAVRIIFASIRRVQPYRFAEITDKRGHATYRMYVVIEVCQLGHSFHPNDLTTPFKDAMKHIEKIATTINIRKSLQLFFKYPFLYLVSWTRFLLEQVDGRSARGRWRGRGAPDVGAGRGRSFRRGQPNIHIECLKPIETPICGK